MFRNIIIIIFIFFLLAGCGSKTKLDNNLSNDNTENIIENNTNNSNSEFEKAIQNLKYAKSINIEYERTSEDTNSEFATNAKYNITIDYNNQKAKEISIYSNNNFGESSKKEISYKDMNLKREYYYSNDNGYSCDKWWYEKYGDDDFSQIYDILEEIKTFTDEDVFKIVGNNYRIDFKNSKYGVGDIGIENGKIKYILYGYSKNTISTNISINFNSYNSDNITLPSEVQNALSEFEFNRVCDE